MTTVSVTWTTTSATTTGTTTSITTSTASSTVSPTTVTTTLSTTSATTTASSTTTLTWTTVTSTLTSTTVSSTSTSATSASATSASATSTSVSSTSVTTGTATPRRFSEIVAYFGVELDATVTQTEVESVAQASLSMYLGTGESSIAIDDVYEVTTRRRNGALTKLASESTTWHVDYRVEVEGTYLEDTRSALAALNDTTAAWPNLSAEIAAAMDDQDISSARQIMYVGAPVVELWMYTTATFTSTSSTTCCVCPWPDVDVPIGVETDDFQSISNRLDLLRIECTGFKWGDTCTPVCGPGYHVEENLSCSSVTENGTVLIDGEWQGTARCEPNVCVGSPLLEMPVGYDGVDADCFDRNYTQTCNVSCSVDEGYENLADPILIECTATADYGWVNTTGMCTEKACYADTVPFIANVADSSSCIDIASGASCSPMCSSSYELLAPLNCTRGAFDLAPLVCIPTADIEALDSALGLVVKAALVESSLDSGLTAEWAAGNEQWDAIKDAFGAVLGLSMDQIHVYTVKGLNSDYQSGLPARRLTTLQGLWMQLMLQIYPANNETAITDGLASLNAGGGNLTSELAAALRKRGVAVPEGLTAATLVVGTPVSTIATVPVARWVARDDWSVCSNLCGAGVQTRTVECVTGFDDLCNANAPPGYTKESFMPDTRVCEIYVSCPYDWTCPSGADPITGEGCDAQASFVVGAIVVSFFIVCACTTRYVRKMCVRPRRGSVGVRLSRHGKKVDIEWTRQDGITDKDGNKQKSRLSYNLGPDEMSRFYEEAFERAPGCATLMRLDEVEDPIGPVDLNFNGTMDFEIQLKVRTLAKDSLLVGKVFPHSEPLYSSIGKPKAMVIKHGIPAWQVGDECVTGKTNVADGYQHVLSVRYSTNEDAYILKVDGKVEALWYGAVADNPDTKLVLGTSYAPRDDTFNELYPDFEDLHSAGIELLPLEERGEEPLFDGDIDGITWKEYRWNKDLSMMAWFEYDLRIETEDGLGTVVSKQAIARPPPEDSGGAVETRSVVSASHMAFQKGQKVEYWSKTLQNWIPARIVDDDSKHVYFDQNLELNVIRHKIFVVPAARMVNDVEINDLRLPLVDGESVSVFSKKHGRWFPASIKKSWATFELDPRLGYDVKLEDELAGDGETRVKTELQRALETYRASRGDIAPSQGSQSEDGDRVSRHDAEQRGSLSLKNMTSKRLRRRYARGDPVSVYRGVDVGFIKAEFVREIDPAELGPRAEAEQTVRKDKAAPAKPERRRPAITIDEDDELDRKLASRPVDRLELELERKLSGLPADRQPRKAAQEKSPKGAATPRTPRSASSRGASPSSRGSDHDDGARSETESREAPNEKRVKKTKPSASGHRHATVVIRFVSDSQESPSQDGGEGAGAMPGDNEIRVSELLLRRRVVDQPGVMSLASLDLTFRRLFASRA